MNQAFWKFEFEVRADAFDWKYDFRQLPGLKLQGNHEERKGDILKLPRSQEPNGDEDLIVKRETLQGIGPISGVFHVYDQEQLALRRLNISQSITDCLKGSVEFCWGKVVDGRRPPAPQAILKLFENGKFSVLEQEL